MKWKKMIVMMDMVVNMIVVGERMELYNVVKSKEENGDDKLCYGTSMKW